MPFYLANPRKGNSKVQSGQTGRTSHVRTEPSSLAYVANITYSTLATFLYMLAPHCVLLSILYQHYKGSQIAIVIDTVCSLVSVPFKEMDILLLPKVSLIFDGEPSESQITFIEKHGGEMHAVQKKGNIYILPSNKDTFGEISSWMNLSDSGSPLADSVFVTALDTVTSIWSVIYSGALVVDHAYGRGSIQSSTYSYVNKDVELEVIRASKMGDAPVTQKMDFLASNHKEQLRVTSTSGELSITVSPSSLGSITDNGLFLPFEPNFAKTDNAIMSRFLQKFRCFTTDDDTADAADSMIDVWLSGLSRTFEGDQYAHIMSSVLIALDVRAGIRLVVDNDRYLGVVLYHGAEFSIHCRSVVHKSLSAIELREEIAQYSSHGSSLSAIKAAAGIDPTIDIQSMRDLRKRIFTIKNNGITTLLKGQIMEHLGFLDFNEKPEPINRDTLSKFLIFMASPTIDIVPDNVYLDRSAFFETDVRVLTCSMFGRYCPSPSGSGKSYRLIPAAVQNPPPVPVLTSIKFQMKPFIAASKDWAGLAKNPVITFDDRFTRNSRKFKGTDAAAICGAMVTYASVNIDLKKGESSKRKVTDATETVGEKSGAKKARVTVNPFA